MYSFTGKSQDTASVCLVMKLVCIILMGSSQCAVIDSRVVL